MASFHVTYHGNGNTDGFVPVDPASYHMGDSVVVLDNSNGLARTGFVFSGWNTDAPATGIHYDSGDSFAIADTNVDLHADWQSVDATPPTIVTFSINSNASLTHVAEATLNLQATDDASGVKEMRFSQDGGAEWTDWQAYATSTAWTLEPGYTTRTVQVEVRDNALNVASGADSIDIDTRGPLFPWLSINGGAGTCGSISVTMTAGASTAVTAVSFANEYGEWSPWAPYSAPFTTVWALIDVEVTRKVLGRFKDSYGNVSFAQDLIVLDRTPPAISSFVINGGDVRTANPNVTLSFTVTGEWYDVSLANDGGSWESWISGGFDGSWTLADLDGTRAVHIRFRDFAGNIPVAAADSIELDRVAPVLGSFGINSGASDTTSRSVTLNLGATGATRMRFYNDTEAYSGWIPYATSHSWTLRNAQGLRYVYAQVGDETGWTSDWLNDSINLTLGSVVVNDFSVDSGAEFTKSTLVTLNSNVSGATQMRFNNDGGTWGAWVPYAASYAWTLAPSDGGRTVYAQYRDAIGNTDSAWDLIWLDRTVPVISSFSINNGAATTLVPAVTLNISVSSASEMSFSNATDGSGWSAWQPYRSTTAWVSAGGSSAGEDGTKTVSARFRDQAGNIVVTSDTISLDAWKTVRVSCLQLFCVFTGDVDPEYPIISYPGEWYWEFCGLSSQDDTWHSIDSRAKADPWLCQMGQAYTINKYVDLVVANAPGEYVGIKGYVKEDDGYLGTNDMGSFDSYYGYPSFGPGEVLDIQFTGANALGILYATIEVLN
jgi:hypothetical protein